jgi:succinate dehydrogenase / fumarate reductase cytochrome b subunit
MSSSTDAPAAPAPNAGKARTLSLYKGDPGMWSWALHRITGVAVFFFLFVHVLDTAMVRVNPETYNKVIETYKNPVVGLMEIGLVAAVLFHALNGVRVILVDFWSKGPRYQKLMLWIILAIWFVCMVPETGRLLYIMFTAKGN